MLVYQYPSLAFLLVLAVAVQGWAKTYYDLTDAEQHFANFIDKYEKHYESTEEYNRRFVIFKKKLSMINYWNSIHEPTFDVNQFADEEPSQNKTGFIPSKLRAKTQKLLLSKKWLRNAPTSLDYRTFGLVTEVKHQSKCNSCYVFGAVGNIEGQYAKLTGELISLSNQQALDCAGWPCSNGGDDLEIIRDLSEGNGLVSEEDYYPYNTKQPKQKSCHHPKGPVIVKVASGGFIYTPDEETLKAALLEHGPVSISIYASPSIKSYDGRAVLRPFDCYGYERTNHVVLLVGYSTDSNGTPYWIIKNSWGKHWGHEGYLHLEMGKGHCSILKEGAVYVRVMVPQDK